MISTLALLPFLAASGALIDGVGTNFDGEQLTVEVSASGKLSAHDLAVKPGKGRFFLYVGDARSDRGRYVTPERTVVAHARSTYTKLEIPWGKDVECDKDVAVELMTGGGARARVKCRASGAAAAAPTRAGRRPATRRGGEVGEAKGEPSEAEILREALALPVPGARKVEPKVEAAKGEAKAADPHPGPLPQGGRGDRAAVEAKGALEAGEKDVVVKKAAARDESARDESARDESARGESARDKGVAHDKGVAQVKAPDAAPDKTPPYTGAASSSSATFILPALLLAALAGAAFYFAKRRAGKQGMINILESASLGPKRALVVASVNGKTMILGTSEAGITLLGSLDDRGEVMTVAAPSAAFKDDDISVDEALPREPSDQEGILAKLFRKRAVDDAVAAPPQESWKQFDELLNESLEDQELRHKLASGIGGKVS